MEGRGKGWATVAMLALVLAWPWAGQAWAGPVLQAWTGDPPRMVLELALESHQPFHLEHVSSMYGARVRESFMPRPGGGMTLFEVQSDSPAVHEYFGLVPGPGGVAAARRELTQIRLLSMSYEQHRLMVDGVSRPLADLASPGQELRLTVVGRRQP